MQNYFFFKAQLYVKNCKIPLSTFQQINLQFLVYSEKSFCKHKLAWHVLEIDSFIKQINVLN